MNWLQSVRAALHQGKDISLAMVLQRLAQPRLAKFGFMQHLVIDSKEKSIRFDLRLKGESEALAIHILDYALESDGVHTYFTVKNVRASREWIQAALEQFVVGKKFQFPDHLARLLKAVL